jgi:hypothetical protein
VIPMQHDPGVEVRRIDHGERLGHSFPHCIPCASGGVIVTSRS